MTTAIVLFGAMALLLIIGVPISISLGAATMLSMLTFDVPLAVVGQRMFTALDSVSIMAIPFFVLEFQEDLLILLTELLEMSEVVCVMQ